MAAARCNVAAVEGAVAPAAVRGSAQVERLGASVQGLGLSKFAGLRIASTGASASRGASKSRAQRVAVRATAAVETAQKTDNAVVEKSVNTIRFLAIDAVEKANSGHPVLPMGCAPMDHILYDEVMKYLVYRPSPKEVPIGALAFFKTFLVAGCHKTQEMSLNGSCVNELKN